jgi:hypothetical protein
VPVCDPCSWCMRATHTACRGKTLPLKTGALNLRKPRCETRYHYHKHIMHLALLFWVHSDAPCRFHTQSNAGDVSTRAESAHASPWDGGCRRRLQWVVLRKSWRARLPRSYARVRFICLSLSQLLAIWKNYLALATFSIINQTQNCVSNLLIKRICFADKSLKETHHSFSIIFLINKCIYQSD